MRKAIALVLSIPLFCGVSGALASSKIKPQDSKPQVNLQQTAETLKKALREPLVTCNTSYKMEMLEMESKAKLIYSQRRSDDKTQYESPQMSALRAKQEVVDKKSEAGYDYKKCVDRYKEAVSGEIKTVVADFKSEKHKSLAKQIISQWLAAIDSIGREGFDQELGKFDKASSDLLVEVMAD